uniref:Uncharacterized protein n=1 Tax=Capsella bursa-pastoris TaxID=3719 RepID=A0A6H1YJH3_CAPBU|nr:hypothetical protein [Capsella bursa-pastoris]
MLKGAKSIGAGAATIASAGAGFFGLGSEGVSRFTLFMFFILVVVSICLFRCLNKYLGKRMTQWCYLALVCQISLFIVLLRGHVLAGFGTLCADLFTVFMGTLAVSGSSGEIVNHQAGTSSEWLTYTSDMVEDSASSGRSSSVNQPLPEEPAWEREARAREHERISAEIESIMAACEKEEAAMIRKAHMLLHQRGIALDDPEDVKRALQLALHDDWEHDIDSRQRHFTMLKRDFGTTRCERWNPFIDELRGLGNHQVNARHYVD